MCRKMTSLIVCIILALSVHFVIFYFLSDLLLFSPSGHHVNIRYIDTIETDLDLFYSSRGTNSYDQPGIFVTIRNDEDMQVYEALFDVDLPEINLSLYALVVSPGYELGNSMGISTSYNPLRKRVFTFQEGVERIGEYQTNVIYCYYRDRMGDNIVKSKSFAKLALELYKRGWTFTNFIY